MLFAPDRITISAIHVSTVGPWASLVVTIANRPETLTDILEKVHGEWMNRASAANGSITSPITGVGATGGGEQCVMPSTDVQNLGFPPCK